MRSKLLMVFGLMTLLSLEIAALPLDCDSLETRMKLSDFPDIGPKVTSEEVATASERYKGVLKKFGCTLQRGYVSLKDKARVLGSDLKDRAADWRDKAKDFSRDFQIKFKDFQKKLTPPESLREEIGSAEGFISKAESVEIINPKVLMGEQKCGQGHILDALGNCLKLRR